MYLVVLAVAISTLFSSLTCDRVEDGWMGIKTLSSDRKYVEKVLGPGHVDSYGYLTYTIGDASVEVNYSVSPCTADSYGRGKYDVPAGAVLDYWVSLKPNKRLSDLKFTRDKYKKDSSGDLENFFSYVNSSDAITIGTVEIDAGEFVRRLSYRPKPADAERLLCKKLDPGTDR